QLSKEANAKTATSGNFSDSVVVNSESVYNHVGSAANSGSTSVIESGKLAIGTGSGGTASGPYGGSSGTGGGSTTGGSNSGGKKRKADARSTPTSSAGSNEMDSNRDLIRDVAVSLVPLSLNKNDHIDPLSIGVHEKNVKKVSDTVANNRICLPIGPIECSLLMNCENRDQNNCR
uniref:Uncharacterized protein n=1 Tax=Anopheles maculatus TaxID=74869 RepID=A0A182SW03_9DIPT